jgi:uncharacterized lipoprotein NlpE involved in copper resistance
VRLGVPFPFLPPDHQLLMRKIFLFVAIIAALYNITGCRNAQSNIEQHQPDSLSTLAGIAEGINHIQESNYVGAVSDGLSIAAQSQAFDQEDQQLHHEKSGCALWAWIWGVAALVVLGNGGKSKG